MEFTFKENITFAALSFLTNSTFTIFSDNTTGVSATENKAKVSVNTYQLRIQNYVKCASR